MYLKVIFEASSFTACRCRRVESLYLLRCGLFFLGGGGGGGDATLICTKISVHFYWDSMVYDLTKHCMIWMDYWMSLMLCS